MVGVIGDGWGCVAGGSLGALEWEALEALAAVGRAGVSAVVRTRLRPGTDGDKWRKGVGPNIEPGGQV